jgi:hypothetical protein
MNYPQLIYGKLVDSRDFGYKKVAWNSEHSSSENIPPYKFFKGELSTEFVSIGLAWDEQQPILIQSSSTSQISGTRSFMQTRYVFLSPESFQKIKGKTYHLLNYLYGEEIPTFQQINNCLEPLSIPLLSSEDLPNSPQDEIEIIKKNTDNYYLVLTGLDKLISGKRIVLSVEHDIYNNNIEPTDFLAILFLMLPVAIRSHLSIAFGTVDEEFCKWAKIILTYSSIKPQLSDDLIRIRRKSNPSTSGFNKSEPSPEHYTSEYVNFIQDILKNTEQIPAFLEKINEIADENISLNNLDSPQAILPIIKFLPEQQQESRLTTYLSTITDDQWTNAIQSLKDNPQRLFLVGQELINREKLENLQFFLEVWKLISKPINEAINELIKLLKLLKPDSDFTRSLIQQGLLNNHPITIKNDLTDFCLKVITQLSLKSQSEAYKLAEYITTIPDFQLNGEERLQLLNASTPDNQDRSQEILNDPNYPQEIIRLILQLPETEQNDYWKKYLSGLNQQKWSDIFDSILNQVGLSNAWTSLKNDYSLNKSSDNITWYPETMVKVWNKIEDEERLKVFLNEDLDSDLSLARNLLDFGLAETKYLQQEIKELISKVVSSLSNLPENKPSTRSFVDELSNRPLFEKNDDRFFLFDSLITTNFTTLELYDFLNEFGYLIAYLSITQFNQSKLCRQLSQNNIEVVNQLSFVINQGKQVLHKLVKLAQSTKMSNSQQDKFYLSFLNAYSPSLPESQELIITLIEIEYELSSSNLGMKYPNTYNYFKDTYNLSHLFQLLQSPKLNFSIWEDIVALIEQKTEQKIKMLDRLVGKQFVIKTLQTWFSVLKDQPQLNSNSLITNSEAWKSLNKDQLLPLLLLIKPESLTMLTQCIIESQKYEWIAGDLLYHLCEHWKSQKSYDSKLLNCINSPSITNDFNNQNWLELYYLKWKLDIDIHFILSEEISLSSSEQEELFKTACEFIKKQEQAECKMSIFSDCKILNLAQDKLLILAVKVIKSYTQFEQKKELLDQCIRFDFTFHQLCQLVENLIESCYLQNQTKELIDSLNRAGWNSDQQRTIFENLPLNSYSFTLLSSYLYPNRQLDIKLLEQHRSLFVKLFALKTETNSEKADYEKLVWNLIKLEKEGKGEYSSLFTSTSEPEMVGNIFTERSEEVIQNNKWFQLISKLPIQCEWCIKVRQNCVKIVAQLLGVKISIEK